MSARELKPDRINVSVWNQAVWKKPKAQTTDARIITATNVDLAEKVKTGSFREDLYYRLQVINIHIPPLRERKEDLIALVELLMGHINRELHRNITHISKETLNCLENYDWPGNIREL